MMVQRRVALSVVSATVALLWTVGAFAAGKPAKAEKPAKCALVTLVGSVAETKDEKGRLTGVTLTEDSGTVHNLKLTAPAKKLAKELAGQKAEVLGKEVKQGKKGEEQVLFQVKTFKAAPAAPAPEPDAVPTRGE